MEERLQQEQKGQQVDFTRHEGGLAGEYEQKFKSQVLGLPGDQKEDLYKR